MALRESQRVDITEDGAVCVGNVRLDGLYITDKELGEGNIQLPLQVSEGKVLAMKDHHYMSVGSRSIAIGHL